MRMLAVGFAAVSAYFSRIALAADIHSSDRNWWLIRIAPLTSMWVSRMYPFDATDLPAE
jgi:hypothetical protein